MARPRGCRLRPVEAVQIWLAAAEISTGPVFRAVQKGRRVRAVPLTPHSAAQIVKAYAKRGGLDAQGFAGHSRHSGVPLIRSTRCALDTARPGSCRHSASQERTSMRAYLTGGPAPRQDRAAEPPLPTFRGSRR